MKTYLITWNQKKLEEIKKNISNKIKLKSQKLDIEELQSLDMWEISKQKAINAYKLLQKPVLVDDSGIYFDAYNNFPWTFAKFAFLQLWFDGFEKLLQNGNNTWSMKTILSYMDWTLSEPIQLVGEKRWTWKFNPKYTIDANSNVPYNNIFYLDWKDKPISEDYENWVKDNHRAKAVRKLNEWIDSITN